MLLVLVRLCKPTFGGRIGRNPFFSNCIYFCFLEVSHVFLFSFLNVSMK